MTSAPPTAARRSPALLLALAAALLLAVLAPVASAAPPPSATQIDVTSVTTPSITVPDTVGAPDSFIVRDVPFDVAVSFLGADGTTPLPISDNKDVTLSLTVLTGPQAGEQVASISVPRGATSAVFSGVLLGSPANQVSLRADVDGRKYDEVAPGDSASFEVLRTFETAPATSTLTSIGSGGGIGTACEATPEEPVCADLVLPDSAGVLSSQLLSLGVCDSFAQCPADRSVVQALVDLDPTVYTHQSPATLVMKCDKTSCQGGGIPAYTLTVSLEPTDPPTTAPPCTTKGEVDPGLDFCVDYVQSTRDNAGDTHLFLLFVRDARVRFP